ncbi:hypothetical protein [Marinithermus hydrothermalis]|uniref:Uncharacterized protein n=1 Tax=Marinithermus hydrothermalis (strain DSM 14884 / JCM 11576 / T1) TaxID=869210 RepID=F2NPK3_MARHT|nr:hypothetical protein [Marinithermus hydrothermalis]AEB12504.1 hypothetical protein Marky_1770 [Marinithermus hydrothermalis DSM 14884]
MRDWRTLLAACASLVLLVVLAQPPPPTLQEIIPLPGPHEPDPQAPPSAPSDPKEGACEPEVYLFDNGRFYRILPGEGEPGAPSEPREIYPIEPAPPPPSRTAPPPQET